MHQLRIQAYTAQLKGVEKAVRAMRNESDPSATSFVNFN